MKPLGHNRFFIESGKIGSGTFKITGEELRHLKVKRLKAGSKVVGVDGNGLELTGRIISKSGKEVICDTIKKTQHQPPANKIILGIGIIKSNRMAYACEKVAELGAWQIIPVNCENSVKEINANELNRLNRITLSAMKQSGRCFHTKILNPCNLKSLLHEYSGNSDICFLDHEGSSISEIPKTGSLVVLIGPEGGFSDIEISNISKFGGRGVSLGSYRLRSETAAALAVGCLGIE